MKRIYAVIELTESSTFEPSSDEHLDELADDLLRVIHGVSSAAVYASAADLLADEGQAGGGAARPPGPGARPCSAR